MVVIIGGGGAGLYYACLAKEKKPKRKVSLVEEHLDIGKPVQCTGILTKEIKRIMPGKEIEKFTQNKITRTRIHSPKQQVTTRISEDIIIDNVAFIKHLYERALKAGVEMLDGHRYIRNEGRKIILRNTRTKEEKVMEDNYLVGADGPSSLVAKNNGLYGKREFIFAVQTTIKVKDKFDKGLIEFYPYIGEYAWFTPESGSVARVGVAAKRNAKKVFDEFIKKYPGERIGWQGGPIPFFNPGYKVYKRKGNFRVALIGDAAMHVKNTTGGGIIAGMKAAEALAKGFDSYPKNVKPLHRELYVHFLLNKMLSKYKDKDWDSLVRKVNDKKIQRILEDVDRDNATKMVLKLALQPKMFFEGIKAARKLFF